MAIIWYLKNRKKDKRLMQPVPRMLFRSFLMSFYFIPLSLIVFGLITWTTLYYFKTGETNNWIYINIAVFFFHVYLVIRNAQLSIAGYKALGAFRRMIIAIDEIDKNLSECQESKKL